MPSSDWGSNSYLPDNDPYYKAPGTLSALQEKKYVTAAETLIKKMQAKTPFAWSELKPLLASSEATMKMAKFLRGHAAAISKAAQIELADVFKTFPASAHAPNYVLACHTMPPYQIPVDKLETIFTDLFTPEMRSDYDVLTSFLGGSPLPSVCLGYCVLCGNTIFAEINTVDGHLNFPGAMMPMVYLPNLPPEAKLVASGQLGSMVKYYQMCVCSGHKMNCDVCSTEPDWNNWKDVKQRAHNGTCLACLGPALVDFRPPAIRMATVQGARARIRSL